MEMKSATKSERRTSYVFEIPKRYRKVIFPQCKKRHCLVVRKEGVFLVLVVLFFPLQVLLCDGRMTSVASPADLMFVTDCCRGSQKISLIQRKYP